MEVSKNGSEKEGGKEDEEGREEEKEIRSSPSGKSEERFALFFVRPAWALTWR